MPAKPEWKPWCVADDLQVREDTVHVSLPDGRGHRVRVDELNDGYRLTARVASSAVIGSMRQPELEVWLRNRSLQLVGFHIDRHGRLLGEARVPRAALEGDEFRLYLRTLAAECDRLEALLTGADTA